MDTGTSDQLWRLISVEGDYYKLLNVYSGKYLCISGGSTADGGNAIQYQDTSGNEQQWLLTKLP